VLAVVIGYTRDALLKLANNGTGQIIGNDNLESSSRTQWVLRLSLFLIFLFFLNVSLLIMNEGIFNWFASNLSAFFIYIFLLSMIGRFIDKKIGYLILRLYDRLEKTGLIVVEGPEQQIENNFEPNPKK
jgi:hypothetical protein